MVPCRVETKEVQLRPKTDSNDLATKMKSAIKFLEKGKKVRLVMKLEGRELQFRDSSKEVLMKFLADVEQVGKPEVDVNYKGGSYTLFKLQWQLQQQPLSLPL
ncbi:uncharacterized protein HaLaN_27399 [Haematococcus lacustris]|uniref:Translation initiation factor 3 C-terminal domain-containing protein n=1 Tax=Haematococcus lacustris TaxID=44745 RepID=A0A6A0A9M2_HAELA|nr:uncharacterized protein HaLaN_27399 [Haematococcus lacustris]